MCATNYIIVQAGGKGSRLGNLTENKPKALVSVNNLPLIFHLFKTFPDKKFIIIGDCKYDVLNEYLKTFAEVKYVTVNANGHTGTCAGIEEALNYIPENASFMLIWCDLILAKNYKMPECTNKNIIGISNTFPCRWKYENNIFTNEQSHSHGVAGMFIFQNKSYLSDIPKDGEFVRWLQHKSYIFSEHLLHDCDEYGTLEKFKNLPKTRCRPFNSLEFKNGRVIKIAIDEQGEKLAEKEILWYKAAKELGFKNIPFIYSYEPLCMSHIEGKNIYEYKDAPMEQKKNIIDKIIDSLCDLHNLKNSPTDEESYYKTYIEKTFERLEKIRNLVPFSNNKTICINGRLCRNVFFFKEDVENKVMQYIPKKFRLIHGDCTFSNILIDKNNEPVFIDPRGYFGNTELFGDVAYDWVKLYYSVFSNYDQFNMRNFSLKINDSCVELKIESNKFEELEDYFFERIQKDVSKEQIKLFLAIIWLSLTTYSWDDYDSICAAFYNGLYYLEEAL